jgi:hypothetical protein
MAKSKNTFEDVPTETTETTETATVDEETKTVESREDRVKRSKMDAAVEDGGYAGKVGSLGFFNRIGDTGDYRIQIEINGHMVSGMFNPITKKFKGEVYHTV